MKLDEAYRKAAEAENLVLGVDNKIQYAESIRRQSLSTFSLVNISAQSGL